MTPNSRRVVLITTIMLSLFMESSASPIYAKSKYAKKIQMGQLLYFNKRIDEAIKAFRAAAVLKPNAVMPHRNLVNLYIQTYDFPKAIEECRAVLRIKKNDRVCHYLLAAFLIQIANETKSSESNHKLWDEAASELDKAENLGFDASAVSRLRVLVEIQNKNYSEAIRQMEKSLELSKSERSAAHIADDQFMLAALNCKNGDNGRALELLDSATTDKLASNVPALLLKAHVLTTMERLDEALIVFKKVTDAEPDNLTAWMGQASIYKLRNNQAKLEECFEQVQRIDLHSGRGARSIESVRPDIGDFDLRIFDHWARSMPSSIQGNGDGDI